MGVALAQTVPHVHSLSHSLLFSLDVEEGSGALGRDAVSSAQLQAQLALLSENMQFLLRPQSIFQSKLLRDVRAYKDRVVLEEEDFDVVSLAAWLSNLGYRVHIRAALGGGQGTDCFHNLRHEFLVVQGEGDHGTSADLIVEPAFQAQFKISHSTPRYDGLLAMIPVDLVTTPAMLSPLVQLLCAEMQLAFEHHGLSLPPWRQSKSMLSKWLPQKSRDFEPSPYGSPRAASPDPHGFPLLGIAHSTSSGYQSPGAGDGPAPASPRAVLTGASAVLSSQAGRAQQLGHGLALGRAKSLLSDRLAASSVASSIAAQAPAGPAAAQPERELARRSSSQPLQGEAVPPQQQQPQQQGPPALYRVSTGSGMVYRIDTAWQEPPIRKVKMQGPPAQRT